MEPLGDVEHRQTAFHVAAYEVVHDRACPVQRFNVRLAGKEYNDWRDEEPGKILHEIRHGEIAELGILPFQPYYGTHDATSLFLVQLAHVYEWTADRDLLVRYLPAAEAAMAWIDRYGDRDGDGFQEYATRSSKGFYNQGWKDAHDAIPDEHGARAGLPLALCELQGYAYDAKLRLAQIYEVLDREEEAARLRTEAYRLFERFNDAF